MGGDGGSIPHRSEMVKNRQKPKNASKEDAHAAKWNHCVISQDPLRQPIVSCRKGCLYNKESVIKLLMNRKKNIPDIYTHIKKLKDIKELKLTPDKDKSQVGTYLRFICPINHTDMNGTYKFLFLWKCGCVMSKRAFDNISEKNCPICETAYLPEDVVILNSEKNIDVSNLEEIKKQAIKSINSKSKRKIPDKEGPPKKIATKCEDDLARNPEAPAYFVPDKNDKTYKSLFITSEEAKSQASNHWVTFNPQYFR